MFSLSDYQTKDTVSDIQAVIAAGQGRGHVGFLLDNAIELAKGRQSSCAHPHNEVLVDKAIVVRICWIQLIHRLPPVHRLIGP